MSFIGSSGLGLAAGPASGLRFSGRGRIQGSPVAGVSYPSPFFDIAHTYLPTTVKALFRWCRYYFLTNPLINATCFKLAEYPITDLIVDHDSPQVRKRWTEYLHDHMRIRAFQIECGLDYHAYGNAMPSLGFPFKKILSCAHCDFRDEAPKSRAHWVFTNYQFRLNCPKCGNIGDAKVHDLYLKNPSGIRPLRWNPEDIEITYNDITGDYTYFYTIPAPIRNDIVVGRRDVVETIPQVFIQALKEQKGIVFSKDNFFHMRRPSLATQDRGWGTPLLLPVLKDTFYLQLLKKAQEAILLEHIVPLRILFPQAGSGVADPYSSINLADWRDHVASEIARWRLDSNYIPILPLPVGNQTIGGDGRALLLTGEIQAWSEQIMVGMGVPREFLMGGLSYAGTNVSMRMLENAFLGYTLRHKAMVRFLVKQIAAFLDWPEVRIRFKPFKMADDLQRLAYNFQLNQAGKLSDSTLLAGSDFSQEDENAIMMREADTRAEATKKQQLASAEVQGEVQLVMMKYQARAQEALAKAQGAPPAPGEPGAPDGLAGGAPGGGELAAAGPEPAAQAPSEQAPMGQGAQQGPAAADFLSSLGSQLSTRHEMARAQAPANLNVDLPSFAMAQARMLAERPPAEQQTAVENLRLQSPELADMVVQFLRGRGQGQNGAASPASPSSGMTAGVDMRPLPEQLPPRRALALV